MEWTSTVIQQLRDLWTDKRLSTAEIGKRLHCSKNAIIGKARRLDLPGRPSPILAKGSGDAQFYVKPIPTPLPSFAPVETPPVLVQIVEPPEAAPMTDKPPPVIVRPLPSTLPFRVEYVREPLTCRWPMGGPGRKNFRFCDAARPRTCSYCEEHAKLAYAKVRDHPDDAYEDIR